MSFKIMKVEFDVFALRDVTNPMAPRWNSKESLTVIPRANRFEKLNFFLAAADGWPRLVQNFNVNKVPAVYESAKVLRDYFRHIHFNTFTMFVGDGGGKRQIRVNIKDTFIKPGKTVRIKGLVGGSHYNGRVGKLFKFDTGSGRWRIKLCEAGTSSEKIIAVKPQNFEVVQSDELLKFRDEKVIEVVLGHNDFAPDPVAIFHFYFNANKVRAGDAAAVQHYNELLEIQDLLMASLRATHPEDYGKMENPQAGMSEIDQSLGAIPVEEKFTKFSGEPRDARKICVIRPIFGRILSKIDVKSQNRALPKFQILVPESKIDLHSEIKNRSSKSKPLIPLESRFET
jgi:hypothetical protein